MPSGLHAVLLDLSPQDLADARSTLKGSPASEASTRGPTQPGPSQAGGSSRPAEQPPQAAGPSQAGSSRPAEQPPQAAGPSQAGGSSRPAEQPPQAAGPSQAGSSRPAGQSRGAGPSQAGSSRPAGQSRGAGPSQPSRPSQAGGSSRPAGQPPRGPGPTQAGGPLEVRILSLERQLQASETQAREAVDRAAAAEARTIGLQSGTSRSTEVMNPELSLIVSTSNQLEHHSNSDSIEWNNL